MDRSRRDFLRLAASGTAALCAPRVLAKSARRPTLRVLGTHVTLQEPIRRKAEADLGISIEFQPRGSAAVIQQASTRPETFDIYEQWSNSINVLWQAKAIQAIDRSRIERWDQINDLTKTGRLTDYASLGAGDAPYKLLYVQGDRTLGSQPAPGISFLPYVHNVDAFGYDTRHIPKGRAYEDESWGWLLDSAHAGRVALVNEPTIGLFDAALAAQARGLMTFGDIGAMTRGEIDELFEILLDYKLRGHFTGFWNSVPESVEFMRSGRAVIESMFSPGASALNGLGVPAAYAAPREGYRAWHGVMCLSSAVDEETEEAAYRFMNWWLSGWAGAFIARQGYYISIPELAREHLSPEEWAYWYEGEKAKVAIKGTDGRVIASPGAVRNGGSYFERLSNVAVWNTVMDTYEYTLDRWGELLSV